MGHAGAIVSGGKGTAAAKIQAFKDAGIAVAATPSEMAESLLKMKGVTATADVALGKSFVDVKSLDAQGGAFHILGRYHAAKDSSDGAFLIDSGSLALGIGLSGGTSSLQLVGAKIWFREHMAR